MKITKRQLRRIIRESIAFDEGLYEQGREAAYDQDAWNNSPKNGGDAEPESTDPSYMKGWDEAVEELQAEAGDYDDRKFGHSDLGDANDGYGYD